MVKLTKIQHLCLMLAVFGILATAAGLYDKSRLDTLDQEGVTVPGTIVTGMRSTGKNTSYMLGTIFTTQTGGQFQKQFKVSAQFFDSHMKETAITNPSVQVRYHPSNADNCIILGGSTDNAFLFPFGCIAFVVAIFVMYIMRGEDSLFAST